MREIPFHALAEKILDLKMHTLRAVTDNDVVSSTNSRHIGMKLLEE